ncbi:glucans biosynthesis glucosyltransferase MdoH [Aestuariibius sp. 2305UL40-4]|uniref:glucans biosynthesis glucosyltransferase MdoH n=1 Tax=Aestuariibius violaceus TaxID=3234132 RepID=UPI00345E14B0
MFLLLLAVFSFVLVFAFAQAVDTWNWVAWSVLPLMAANALWISGGAATSILGLLMSKAKPAEEPVGWQPEGQTAVLLTLCGEDPEPVAKFLNGLSRGLAREGLADSTRIFVLSDTSDGDACACEEQVMEGLISSDRVFYRRRTVRTNKKPGNIADWLETHGSSFDYMVVLDADSRMSAASIRHLIWKIESNSGLGLCQAGISLIPGRTRFGRYQRVTSRLLSKTFGRGFAAWSGETGNYWGHNAIMRVMAFRAAAKLPELSGSAPFGGSILSHDFIEAAWMRRVGWSVELCPDLAGSAEDAPQTLEEFFKRDRRWCQGNLQHLRLLGDPGLRGLSRYHLLTGIFSYLAAPIWLVLLVLLSSGQISIWGFLPVLSIAAVLLVPKICALIDWLPRAKTAKRRRIILRAWSSELMLSTLLAPLIMLRQATFVGSVLLGRDCGWKSPSTERVSLPLGWQEAGLGIVMSAFAIANGTTGAFWLALVIVPLLSAPILMPRLNELPR